MGKYYGEISFTPAVKELQEKFGSRRNYARMERNSYVDGLTENEIKFIEDRDSFYMATIGTNNYPYIQHRGGPKGFIKVLDYKRIGCIDFRGNMQYISVGNLATNNNVSLIMVDYPTRARLKIYAKATIIELTDDPELYKLLDLTEYKFKPERMLVFDIEAYDWNCPQHITPRYTLEDIEEFLKKQQNQIMQLKEEVTILQTKIKELTT